MYHCMMLFLCLSDTLDLISKTVVGHHEQVAYIASMLGEEMELSQDDKKKLNPGGFSS